MKIAIFSDNLYPEISGISDSIILLSHELTRRGHEILFVGPRYSKKDYAKTGSPPDSKVFGTLSLASLAHSATHTPASPAMSIVRLPSIRYGGSPTGQGRTAFPIGRSLAAMRRFKPDIIHSQSPFGVGLEALFVARILGIPLVGTNHTPVAEFVPPTLRHIPWAKKLLVRYFSWYYNRCVFVSAPCNALLDDMISHGFCGDRIPHRAISNPIDLVPFENSSAPTATAASTAVTNISSDSASSKSALKKHFGFSPHTVLYTGRLAPEKGVDTILRAIALAKKEIPDIDFATTGHGIAENDLRELARELDIEDRVHFLGFVDANTYALIYKASDIFAIMSTAETQSLSLMQAMACGMPVIGARAWGLPEYINNGKNNRSKDGDSNENKIATSEQDGFVLEPGDVNGLTKTIVDLFKDPNTMKKLGENGAVSVKRFSPEVVAKIWEDMYAIHTKLLSPPQSG